MATIRFQVDDFCWQVGGAVCVKTISPVNSRIPRYECFRGDESFLRRRFVDHSDEFTRRRLAFTATIIFIER